MSEVQTQNETQPVVAGLQLNGLFAFKEGMARGKEDSPAAVSGGRPA